jgi:beta-xylosidase
MRRAVILLSAALAGFCAGAEVLNPVIWADVPDISIVRVGPDYYMSSTTMHLVPNVPIMHSRDLVNWEIVDYCADILAEQDDLALRNGKNSYGKGTWASSLRWHDGRFTLSTFAQTTGRTHVYRTKAVGSGPWESAWFLPYCHDNSLFFDDDGKTWMISGNNSLFLVELAADGLSPLPGGQPAVIIRQGAAPCFAPGEKVEGGLSEGSQLFKVNGRYYLFNICWPRGKCRTVVCHRADKITGPWEGRVVLQDKGVAQGGLVDTPDGRWFAYLFQDHGGVGRCPWLVPVVWKDGWPVLGVDGKAPRAVDLPPSKGLIPGIVAPDEFDRKPGDRPLPLVWQWNHNPDPTCWTLWERPGWLRLKTTRRDAVLTDARNQLGQRTFGPRSFAETFVDAAALRDGDFAGLTLFQRQYGFIAVTVDKGQRRVVAMTAPNGGAPVESAGAALEGGGVYLRADCDFRRRADTGTFSYSLDGKTWTRLGGELKMPYTLPHFMGYRFGLFCFSTANPGGHADFDFFHVGGDAACTPEERD